MRRLTLAPFVPLALLFVSVLTNAFAQIPRTPTTILPGTSLYSAMHSVGHRARAPIGVETIEELDSIVELESPLDLTVLPPAVAMSRLVDQKRYRVGDVGGATVVRPLLQKGAVTWLDRPVTLSQKTGTIIDVLNIAREAAGYPLKVSIPRREISESMHKEITLRGKSVVELLSNAVVAHGNAGWIVYYRPNADRREAGLSRFIDVFTYDGSRVAVDFGRHGTLAGPARSSHRWAVRTPPSSRAFRGLRACRRPSWFIEWNIRRCVKTTGMKQDGTVVIEFQRTFMVYKRDHVPETARTTEVPR
jgi:hypothetical protein